MSGNIVPGGVYLTETETAAFLKISRRTLQRWRIEGTGPKFHRFGGLVRYASATLDGWANKRLFSSTSEVDHGGK